MGRQNEFGMCHVMNWLMQKKYKTMSTKNINNIKVIATILLSTFAAICYPQKVLNQVYSSKPIQVDGTTNCPGT